MRATGHVAAQRASWSRKFLAVTEALAALRTEEIVLDGEAMAHCPDGLPTFHGLRSEEGGGCGLPVRFGSMDLRGWSPER
jgi:hypothetical protein